MSDTRVFDFAVIGAGIAGASVAYRLSAAASVLVLEQETQPGYHSTGRSAAMFMETYGTPTVQALTRASRAFYEEPPGDFAERPLLTPRGVMYLANGAQQALLESMQRSLLAGAPDARRLGREETLARVPILRPELVYGAILEPAARDIDVDALHQGFLRGMRRNGGLLRAHAQAKQAQRTHGAWTIALASGDMVHARNIVNAAGAWADEIARLCGAPCVGLEPRRRTAFTFAAPADMNCTAWPAVVGIDESYYFKPDAGQLLGSPANADPTTAHDVMPEEIDVAMGIDRIQNVTTLSIRRPNHIWAGLRSFVADGDLVIGWDRRCDGFFWLAAQGGYGIQTAAAASQLAAALLLDLAVPDGLLAQGIAPAAMSPERFH